MLRTRLEWVLPLAAAGLAPSAPLFGADNEALVQVITEFDGGCCSTCDWLPTDETLVRAWYDEITDSGAHGSHALSSKGFYLNGSVVNKRLRRFHALPDVGTG
ncbi:MAG TPA: hypothetical protein VGM03_21980 [Phycisphaerae bacterium]|jgi:hypothetical protein